MKTKDLYIEILKMGISAMNLRLQLHTVSKICICCHFFSISRPQSYSDSNSSRNCPIPSKYTKSKLPLISGETKIRSSIVQLQTKAKDVCSSDNASLMEFIGGIALPRNALPIQLKLHLH